MRHLGLCLSAIGMDYDAFLAESALRRVIIGGHLRMLWIPLRARPSPGRCGVNIFFYCCILRVGKAVCRPSLALSRAAVHSAVDPRRRASLRGRIART